jgi:penicillin-binding protein 2
MPIDTSPASNRSRLVILQAIFIGTIAIYVAKIFTMQVISAELYRDRAANIARRVTLIPAQRGEIYDRNFSLPMVLNTDSFAVTVTPAEIPKDLRLAVFSRLADFLGITRAQLEKEIPPSAYGQYLPIEVAANIDFTVVARLSENLNDLPGVNWVSKPIRNYVDTGSIAHIVGYVGDITKEELKVLYNSGYVTGNVIGKAGIEKQYDDLLRGVDGQSIRTVDARGRHIEDESGNYQVPPTMGKNLVLTIDREIQTLAEKALGDRMGSVVVMKPSTGEILAMVSYPWYDPNIFNRSDSGALFQQLIDDPEKPFLNRAIQSQYPPASTFKVVMTTGILAEQSFPPLATIECNGDLDYGDRIFHCHLKTGHGPLDLQEALAQSCNIYFMTVGRDDLGVERIVSYAKNYGFGAATGIDLPGEITGFVPTPQWKERRFHEKWLGGDTMNMSIGQGFTLVTPIQMADMVAMVVNDGALYVPHVLKEIRDPISGAIIKTVQPEVLRQSDISPDVFAQVRVNMRSVIEEGTARFPVNIKAVEIAGKTGTAEVGLADHWHSWLASYAPYKTENPDERIVVAVMVEATNKWEWWAPYATAIIYQGIFAQQDYEEAVNALDLNNLVTPTGRRD